MTETSAPSQSAPVRITFHKRTFFEISGPGRTIFVDPIFSQRRRGKRVAADVRSADYVLVTSATPWFDDLLDVLDACEATLVAAPSLCRAVASELDLPKKRILDLEAWERASEPGLRVTALPISCTIGLESAMEEGEAIAEDIQGVFPRSLRRLPLVGLGMPLVDTAFRTGMRTMETVAGMRPFRGAGEVGSALGSQLGRMVPGRPGLGYLIEWEGYPTILHLADGVSGGTSEAELRDIASVAHPGLLIAQVDGMDVQPIVRAARVLEPDTILLYRSRDPYASGRAARTLPVSSFVGALEEGAPDVEIDVMQAGDAFVLDPADPELRPEDTDETGR
jgi:hypothetical protein